MPGRLTTPLALCTLGMLLSGCVSQDDRSNVTGDPLPPPSPPAPDSPALHPPLPAGDQPAGDSPPVAWPPVRTQTGCDNGQAPRYSRNAPLLAPFQGPSDAVAARVANALGDPLRPGEVQEVPGTDGSGGYGGYASAMRVWKTNYGRLSLTWDGSLKFAYGADRIWPSLEAGEAKQELEGFFKRLGLSTEEQPTLQIGDPTINASRHRLSVMVSESHGGIVVPSVIHVTTESYYGNRTNAVVGPLHNLSAARADLPAEEAITIASEHIRCTFGREWPEGITARLAVHNASIVYTVEPPETPATQVPGGGTVHGCPPGWTAYVDAVTKTVHGWESHFCV